MAGICLLAWPTRAQAYDPDDFDYDDFGDDDEDERPWLVVWPEWVLNTGYRLSVSYLTERGIGETAWGSDGEYHAANLSGVTIREQGSMIAGLVGIMFVQLFMAYSATEVIGVYSNTTRNSDGSRTIRTTTYYRINDPEGLQKAIDGTPDAIAQLLPTTEVTLYSPDLPGGEGSGYRVNLLIHASYGSLIFETGYGWGSVDFYKDARELQAQEVLTSDFSGIPIRFLWAGRWAAPYVQLDLNFDNLDDDNMPVPLRVGVQGNLFGHFFYETSLVSPSPFPTDFGWRLQGGFQF